MVGLKGDEGGTGQPVANCSLFQTLNLINQLGHSLHFTRVTNRQLLQQFVAQCCDCGHLFFMLTCRVWSNHKESLCMLMEFCQHFTHLEIPFYSVNNCPVLGQADTVWQMLSSERFCKLHYNRGLAPHKCPNPGAMQFMLQIRCVVQKCHINCFP